MSVTFSGFDEMEDALKELELPVQKKILRATVRKASAPVLNDMQSNADSKWGSDTGETSESIKVRVSSPKNAKWADVAASVGVFNIRSISKLSGSYQSATTKAYWLEFGTQPHALGKKSSVRSGKYQSEGQYHPGTPAKPVIRPALDKNVDEVIEIESDVLGKAIEKAFKKRG